MMTRTCRHRYPKSSSKQSSPRVRDNSRNCSGLPGIEGAWLSSRAFVLIWWAWTGHTVFSTRFDTDDMIQPGLTLVQMFAVAAMAANAKDALDSRSSAGFAAAYAAMRFILVAQYCRARQVPHARPLATRYLVGHG